MSYKMNDVVFFKRTDELKSGVLNKTYKYRFVFVGKSESAYISPP